MGQLGSMLIRAREARGLTLEDAERDTRISRRYLLALEAEDFEVIPAPVYARGFLRSYSQYLGLDPQEMLGLFPSDEPAAVFSSQRPSLDQPVSAVGPARPAWKRPQQPHASPTPARSVPREPTIGVDIGVPVPARRIKADPAAQARVATVVIVAIGAVLGVLLLAFLISRLGGDDGGTLEPTGAGATGTIATGGAGTAPTAGATQSTSGKVPAVIGKSAAAAKQEITAAGYRVSETRTKSSQPKDTVLDQAPAGDTPLAAGQTVTIVLSDGP